MNWLPGKSILKITQWAVISGFATCGLRQTLKPQFLIFRMGIITVPRSQYVMRNEQGNICERA